MRKWTGDIMTDRNSSIPNRDLNYKLDTGDSIEPKRLVGTDTPLDRHDTAHGKKLEPIQLDFNSALVVKNAQAVVRGDRAAIKNAQAVVQGDRVALENAKAVVRGDRAAISNAQAGVESERGTLKNAQVQLGYTKIYAPIDGRAGNILVQQGNVAQASGTTPLMTIVRVRPLQVAFAVPASNLAEVQKPIVAYNNGAPTYLEQLGRVIDSVENDRVASWYDNDRAIILALQRQPGTNTVQVVDTIKKLLPKLQEQIPASIEIGVMYDAAQSVRDSVDDVKFTLVLTIGLVILVIFLFLRNLSATIIPSLALPVSLIGTFVAMQQLHFSLDNLSLMALTLSVGFVVDDAIVMLENIVRHLEMGESPVQAALNGSREISFTILSMTLSLVAVFIPMLFMGGLLGRLFHEFAVTIAVAILISGFVSLSLTPMLCSRFLRPVDHSKQSRLYRASEAVFDKWLAGYDWSLCRSR
jgi:multidrug efflux pump subunit AcrB